MGLTLLGLIELVWTGMDGTMRGGMLMGMILMASTRTVMTSMGSITPLSLLPQCGAY